MEEYIAKLVEKHNSKKDVFIKKMIDEHCNWWQKMWVSIAIKMKWHIWFVNCISQQLPHELNSDFMGINFGIQEKFGVKINGKTYWL